jgi:AcrR family transcriptional regulator
MGNREALLDGALQSLLDKGYAATTARDIVTRAGTSLAAIGYHFGSTEHLLHEAIAEGFRRWRFELAAALEGQVGRAPADLLAAVGDQLTQVFEEQRALFAVFLEALVLAERSATVQAHAAAGYQEDRVAVAALVGSIRTSGGGDDLTLASVLLAVVDGLFIQHLISPADAPTPRAALDLLAPLILGTPTSKRAKKAGR